MPVFLTILLLCSVLCPPGRAAEASVRWKGRALKAALLPEEMPAPARAAVLAFASWADEKGYRMDLTPEGDCLLLVPKKQNDVDADMEWIAKTRERVDQLLPPRQERSDAPPPKSPTTPRKLEDFDLPSLKPSVTLPELPHQVPVLIKTRNPADYRALVEYLVKRHDWLADWGKDVGGDVYGLTLPNPLVGAWLIEAPANEEWDPVNELVNRLAQLLAIDRAGIVPYWAQAGLAWNVERDVRGGIYCFPYRDEFVYVEEHTNWAERLSKSYADRVASPPSIGEVTELKRGRYVDRAAMLAWGALRWMIQTKPEALPEFLRELDRLRRTQGADVKEDGTWTLRPQYEVPAKDQLEVLVRLLGADVLERLGAGLREGVG